jgi:hypothetical protein
MVTVLDSIDASRLAGMTYFSHPNYRESSKFQRATKTDLQCSCKMRVSASRRDQSGARFRVEYSSLLDFRQDRVGDPV